MSKRDVYPAKGGNPINNTATNKNKKEKKENEIYFKTSSLAKEYLLENKIKGGTILIKGSHSTKMDVLSDAL